MVNVDLFVPFLSAADAVSCPRCGRRSRVLFIEVRCFGTASRSAPRPTTEPLSGAFIQVFLIVFSFGCARFRRAYAWLMRSRTFL